jgi:FkbM family methyltransferase
MAIVAAPTRHAILCYEEQDRPVGLSLQMYGEWAEEELYLLSFFLHPGAVVVDVGANIGTHALAFSRFVTSEGRVIAIEPQERVFDLLAAKVLLNGLQHVTCIRALAGQETEMRFLPATERASGTSASVSFVNIDTAKATGTQCGLLVPLQLLKLDDLALAGCDLIKVDVEGMELDVLLGAGNTLRNFRPIVYFEQTSRHRFAETSALFQALDYLLFWHAADPFNRENFRGAQRNIFGGTREINVLALPREQEDQWRDQTSQLKQVRSPEYDAPPRLGPVSGWALPPTAYATLPSNHGNSLVDSLAQHLRNSAATNQPAAAPNTRPSP